jgi:competence protein ComEC
MAVALDPVPVSRLHKGDFVADCDPEDLIYFLLNVGDGDTQLVLLPADADGTRQAMLVDAIMLDKLEQLLQDLAQTPLMPERSPLFAVVVATHPHDDHIAGMPRLIESYHQQIAELWEPGYYHTSEAYIETMHALEDHPEIRHTQPTSGMTRYIGQVRVTVLAPGIGLRNRFDSYGIEINDSSIGIKLEFPTSRVEERRADRSYLRPESVRSLILGADSQTLSWAQVMIDFPQLGPDESVVSQALQKARGVRPLAAEVLKVSHHGSKHGVNLELVEQIHPGVSLISSALGGSAYNFPHLVALESIREGLETTTKSGHKHSRDYELGIHYTCGKDSAGAALGSVALVISPTGRKRDLWRFGDKTEDDIDLTKSRLFD